MKIVVLDPSGNFFEGKGTTGYVTSNDNTLTSAGQIYSKDFATQCEYWNAVIDLLRPADLIICEDYRLYATKSEAQINSNLETPQLIGVIKYDCYLSKKPIILQMAHQVKTRWSNEVLIKTNLIEKIGRNYYHNNVKLQHHSMDAFRHWLHYMTFKDKKQTPKQKIDTYSNY